MGKQWTLYLYDGDEVTLSCANDTALSVTSTSATNVVVRAIAVAQPPSENLLLNPYFEWPMLNGNGWQTAEFPGWQQAFGTWMISRHKDAETSPLPVDDAIEFDIDNNGGWVVGQHDEIWQRVGIQPGIASTVSAGIYGIHHVYKGQMSLTLSARNGAGTWEPLGQFVLRNADGSYNMPMATKTERIWRPVGVVAAIAPDVDALELRIAGTMLDSRDGMKMSGAWITVN